MGHKNKTTCAPKIPYFPWKETNHKTVKIPLKIIEVDEKIAPIVQWLNSYEGITTLFSCEKSGDDCPYISFICRHPEDLIYILDKLNSCRYDCSVSL